MKSTYCVCKDVAVGPRTIVIGNAHHSKEKCVTYSYDRDGKRAIVRYISTGDGLSIPATEVRQ